MATIQELKRKFVTSGYQSDISLSDVPSRREVELPEETAVDANVGTGFQPTVEFDPQQGALERAGTLARNIPRSAFEFGKNIFSALSSPVQTLENVGGLALGGIEKGAEAIRGEDTDTVPRADEAEQLFDSASEMLKQRYGSVDRFRETVIEDPVGAFADIAGLVSGAGAAARGAGTVSKVGGLTRAGETLRRTGQALEPTTAAGRVARSAPVRGAGRVTREVTGDIARSVLPTTEKQIARSLDLTPGDLRNIQNKTGQNVSEFVIRNIEDTTDLTPEDIANRLGETRQTSYVRVRNLVNQVEETYTPDDIPQMNQALSQLDELYKDTPGLEQTQREVASLLGKDNYSLNDVQRAKELLDEADLIFRQSGEVKAGVRSRGLANVRSNMKEFIENKVKENLGNTPGNRIDELNNEVQTAFEVQDAIQNRATRDLTRGGISLFDGLVGLGLGSSVATGGLSVPAATGLFVAQKAVTSPAFRIAVAKNLSRLGKSRVSEIMKQVKNNNVTKQTQDTLAEMLNRAGEESGLAFPVIENVEEIGQQAGQQEERQQ